MLDFFQYRLLGYQITLLDVEIDFTFRTMGC